MADKVVSLEFNVKTAGAVTEINKVTKATEGATAASNQYEKQLNDIKKATEGAGFKDLNKAVKQYQDLALQAGENSPIGRQALAEAGELKDRLSDLKTAIRTTGQDGRALQASLQLGGGIVAGFGAVQGVMALVGSESEDLQRTLVKLQAVQATLASVEEIRSVLEKESALRITAVTIAEKGRAAATALSTFVTNASTLSLKAFRIALIGTGIGAIVVLLGFAAEKMGLFGDSTDDTNKKLAEQKERQEALNKQVDDQIKKTLELRKTRQGGLTDLKNELDILKASGATKTELFKAEKKIIDQQLADLEVAKTARGFLNKEELEEQRQLQVDRHLLNLNYIRVTKEANDEARKKEREARLKAESDEAQKVYETRAEALLALQQLEDETKAAKIKASQDLVNAEMLLIEQQMEADNLLTEQKKKNVEEQIKIEELKYQIAENTTNGLISLGQIFINDSKKLEKFNKAMALVQIGIDTAQAISALTKNSEANPLNAVTGGIAGIAQFASGIARILANIAKAKQLLTSPSPSVGGMGNIGGTAPLSNALPNQTTAPQTPGRVSNLTGSQTTTVKAIVVESDITTTQKRINSIQELAKI